MANELTKYNFNNEPFIQFLDDSNLSLLDLLNYILGTSSDYLSNYKRSNVQYFDNEILVEVEVPRFKRNEINLTLKDEFLTVDCVRKTSNNGRNVLTEKIWVGKGINSNTVSARLTDGVLCVTLPRTQQSKGRQILITK